MKRFIKVVDADHPVFIHIDVDEVVIVSEATQVNPDDPGSKKLVRAPGVVAVTLRHRPNVVFVKGSLDEILEKMSEAYQ